jgi:hypothetical protein
MPQPLLSVQLKLGRSMHVRCMFKGDRESICFFRRFSGLLPFGFSLSLCVVLNAQRDAFASLC